MTSHMRKYFIMITPYVYIITVYVTPVAVWGRKSSCSILEFSFVEPGLELGWRLRG